MTLLTAVLLLAPAQSASFEEIAEMLRKAENRATWEEGAAGAAKALAEMRSPEAMRLRLGLFDDRLDSYKGVLLRDWFYVGMQRAETLAEGDLLAAAAADPKRSPLQRLLCLRALEVARAPVSAEPLFERRLLRAEPELLRAWQSAAGKALADARVVWGRRPEREAEEAREMLLDAGPPGLGFAWLDAWRPEEVAMLAKAAASAKDPGDRAEALRVLAAREEGAAAFVSAATAALRGKDRAPVVAAIEAAARWDRFELAPALIELMQRAAKEEEQLRWTHDAARALRSVTGLPFGPAPEAWSGWWRQAGDAWLRDRRTRGATGSARPAEAPSVQDTAAARFLGLPVDSARVAIVVDGSGSMSTSMLGEVSTVEAAAREVEAFCGLLPDGAVFQVWIVEKQPESAFPHAVPAGRSNREKAMEFLRRREYRSTSSVVEALEAASLDPEVDTIVFVGDGGSSSGAHQLDAHVLDAARRLYARQGVRIHAVLVTDSTRHQRLMEDLAAATGGRMVRASAPGHE